MSTVPAERLKLLCKRYGPGRLPGADNRSIGAGYAFATAALLASVAFIVLSGVQTLLIAGPDGLRLAADGGLLYFGLRAPPFVVSAAFAAGALAWRLVPQDLRYYGPISGLVATVLTYIGLAALLAAALLGDMLYSLGIVVEPGAAVLVGALYGVVGFVNTFWITLPVGALSGYVHERAVAEN
jgi:hypothetical protein